MPRNKHPEETINRILDVSLKLFMEKGYENTSIQNIIDNLGGLSKGAIYHHFKSKEDIAMAVVHRMYEGHTARSSNIHLNEKGKTGLEKLRNLFRTSLNSSVQMEIFQTAPNLLSNSKMLAFQMQAIINETVPKYVKPIIQQGIEDGSIKTDHPQELAEVISLLTSIWLNPMIFYSEPQDMLHRFQFFQQLLQGVGLELELLDSDITNSFLELSRIYTEKRGL